MILSRRIALNGVQLDEVDERILIQSINAGAGKENAGAVAIGRGGSRFTGRKRESTDTTVEFSIPIDMDNMAARTEVFEKVAAWAAGGGWITTSEKPNRRIYGELAQFPAAGDMYEWTSRYTITFRSYGVPYWEENDPVMAYTEDVQTGGGILTVNGSAETQADVKLENKSGMEISTASITIGGKTMDFTSLGLMGDEALMIDHNHEGVLRIRIRDAGGGVRSAMSKRSRESADDFFLKPGTHEYHFTAQRACRVTISVRGRFL